MHNKLMNVFLLEVCEYFECPLNKIRSPFNPWLQDNEREMSAHGEFESPVIIRFLALCIEQIES